MIFLTDYTRDGSIWAGYDIEADNWGEAEARAPQGVRVVGVLVSRVDLTDAVAITMRDYAPWLAK